MEKKATYSLRNTVIPFVFTSYIKIELNIHKYADLLINISENRVVLYNSCGHTVHI